MQNDMQTELRIEPRRKHPRQMFGLKVVDSTDKFEAIVGVIVQGYLMILVTALTHGYYLW